MKYKLAVGLAAALASSLFVTAAAKAAGDSAVTIAVGVDPVFTPFLVADARELFKKYGLNVQIQQHANGGDAADATRLFVNVGGRVKKGKSVSPDDGESIYHDVLVSCSPRMNFGTWQ